MSNQEDGVSRRTVLKHSALATGTLVVGGVAASGTAAAGIGDGRVGHYHLNNIRPDGTVIDASPENNHGTNQGASVVRGGGKVGNAFRLDGNDFIGLGKQIGQAFPALSAAAWMKNSSGSNYEAIVERHYWNAEDGFGLFVTRSGKLSWGHWSGGPTVTSSQIVQDGKWHHVAGTMEPVAGGKNQYRVYIDGELDGSQKSDRGVRSSNKKTAIGRRGEPTHGTYYFDGHLDEVRLYDRALSQSEIQSLAAMGGNSGGKGNGRGRGN